MIPRHVVSRLNGMVLVLPRERLKDDLGRPLHYGKIGLLSEKFSSCMPKHWCETEGNAGPRSGNVEGIGQPKGHACRSAAGPSIATKDKRRHRD